MIETKASGNSGAVGTTEGSVYRSDDRGGSWQRMGNGFSYPWYMGQIRVDPTDPDRVYFMGVPVQVSTDGGRTFRNTAVGAHSDQHAMWIDPTDPNHFIIGYDGGVYISHDRGQTMDFVPNLPIAQYYAIALEMRAVLLRVRRTAGQQQLGGPESDRNRQGITNSDWMERRVVTGSTRNRSADPNTVYAESQNGESCATTSGLASRRP